MTDVALVPWQGPHQILMTARDDASGALMVHRQPLEDMVLPSGEALCCHRSPLLACGERETGRRYPQGDKILLLDGGEQARQLALRADFADQYPGAFRHHHEGRRALGGLLVPPRQRPPRALDVGAHLPLHQPPEQQREQQHQSQGFNAFGLLQEETIDHDRIFEKPVVLRRPMLLLIDGEDLPATRTLINCLDGGS